jgi:hypothetical protein
MNRSNFARSAKDWVAHICVASFDANVGCRTPAGGPFKPVVGLSGAVSADDEAERVLAARTAELASSTAQLCQQKQYDEALAALATIRRPLDDFFDKVMVMVDDEALRNSRLGLLQTVATTFQSIADFSEVVTGGKA